jgi:dihydrofolate reductase
MNSMPVCSVFCGVSLDGFLARPDGDLDWMKGSAEGDAGAGDHGYETFIAGIDTLVWGRKTFEKVMTFDQWYHGDKRVVVLSSRPLDLGPARQRGGRVSGSPADIVARLGATGANNIYVDGGITIQAFLRAGLIRRLIVASCPSSSARASLSSVRWITTSG